LPSPVVGALWSMYIGAAVTAVSLAICIVDMVHVDKLAAAAIDAGVQGQLEASLGVLVTFGLFGGIVGLVMWLVCAAGVRKGRQWGAVVGTVFFGLDIVSMLLVLIFAKDAPASRILSVLICVLGLVAIILAWNRQSRGLYKAFR